MGDGLDESAPEPAQEEATSTESSTIEPTVESKEDAVATAESAKDAPAKIKTVAMEKARIEKKTAELKEKVAKVQAARKTIQKEIQEEVNRALPESLEPEVEKQLRDKFGLVGKKEVSAKELARKEKIDKLKKLKGKLADLDVEKIQEDQTPELNVHDLKKSEDENTWSKHEDASGLERKKNQIRAFDSDLSSEEKAEEEKKRQKLALEKLETAKKAGARSEGNSHFLPEASIQPSGGAWEATGNYYVYLSGEIKYHGFDALKDILPLWIFAGSGVPELLDKSNEWKFNDELPAHVQSENDIPKEVKDYLLGLRARIKDEKARSEDSEKDATAAEEEKSGSDPLDNAKSKKKKDAVADRLASLKSSLDEEIAAGESQEEISESETPASEESSDDFSAKPKKSNSEDSAEDFSEKAEKKEIEESTDNFNPKTEKNLAQDDDSLASASKDEKKNKKRDPFQSKLDMLKAGLEESASTLESSEDPQANKESEPQESLERTRAERKPEDANPDGIADKVTEKLSKNSESMQQFLERRKHKEPVTEAAPKEKSNSNPYLGIFVALSDAVNPGKNTRRSILRTIRAIEGSMENSVVLVTDADRSGGKSSIRFSTRPEFQEGQKVALEDGFVYPIAKSTEESGVVLGYLYVQALPPKTSFDTVQVETLKRAALLIWPVLAKEEEQKKNEKLAA